MKQRQKKKRQFLILRLANQEGNLNAHGLGPAPGGKPQTTTSTSYSKHVLQVYTVQLKFLKKEKGIIALEQFVGAQSLMKICLHQRKLFCPQCHICWGPSEASGIPSPVRVCSRSEDCSTTKVSIVCLPHLQQPGSEPKATPSWPPANQSTPEQFIPFQNANNSNYRHNTKLKQTHFRHSR